MKKGVKEARSMSGTPTVHLSDWALPPINTYLCSCWRLFLTTYCVKALSTLSLCAWTLVSITRDSLVSSRSLCVSCWSEQLQAWELLGPRTTTGVVVSKLEFGPVNASSKYPVERCALCMHATRKQLPGRKGSKPLAGVRFAEVLCVQAAVLVLVHMAGRLSVLPVWMCVCAYWEYAPCPHTNRPVNTEPRLSCSNMARSGGYPWVPKSHHIQLLPTVLFYNHYNEKLLQTSCEELVVLFTKHIWPTWFSERSLKQRLHAIYCQFAPLGQILPPVTL